MVGKLGCAENLQGPAMQLCDLPLVTHSGFSAQGCLEASSAKVDGTWLGEVFIPPGSKITSKQSFVKDNLKNQSMSSL